MTRAKFTEVKLEGKMQVVVMFEPNGKEDITLNIMDRKGFIRPKRIRRKTLEQCKQVPMVYELKRRPLRPMAKIAPWPSPLGKSKKSLNRQFKPL